MKSVLMSINAIHNANIESGDKTNELRTRPPKIEPPFKVFTYESGALGRHKVVNEWICDSMTTWLIYMGIPVHLITTGCVSAEHIRKYTNNGMKELTAMHISNLKIYDKPRELSEFRLPCNHKNDCCTCKKAKYCIDPINSEYLFHHCELEEGLKRPPQSWCYVEDNDGRKDLE